MSGGLAERYASVLARYSRYVFVVLLIATVVMGVGAGKVDSGLTISNFASDSKAAQKLDYIQRNFTGDNATAVQVIVRGDNVLSKDSLLDSLRFQQRLRENETVGPTLRDSRPTVGLSNIVAVAAIRSQQAKTVGGSGGGNATAASAGSGNGGGNGEKRGGGPPGAGTPSLAAQIDALESMSKGEVAKLVGRVLDPNRQTAGPVDPYTLLSTNYEPGSSTANARVIFVFQEGGSGDGELSKALVDGQLAIGDVADRTIDGETFAFGAGIVNERAGQATGQSFLVIMPFALAIILLVLSIAYRDLVDIVLALLGAVLVLVWMGGFMGWAGIGVSQIIIAVPFLLIGLAIDYALHVVMRYREARQEDADISPREGMRRGLSGVTVALGATTFTTAVGFLSNGVSPIQSISEFGYVSAAGIVSAFLIFALFLPTVKIEVDAFLEWLGLDRRKRAFGTAGLANRVLGVGTTVARRAPVAIVVIALLIGAGGGYAATDIETSINQVDFLPRDSPEWMERLPDGIEPGDYHLREQAIFINDNFVQSNDRSTVEILVEGSVTDPKTLERLAAGRAAIANSSTAVTLATGEPSVDGPLSLIRSVAAENETVAALVERSDSDGDGVPDENVRKIYDAVYGAAPERASTVIDRSDGEYRALRLSVAMQGGADTGEITTEMRSVATTIESGDLAVTATGQPIIDELVQRGLLRTLVETFLLTLGIILAFLTVIFYRRYGTLTLGAVTMTPVVFALGWILGTMYLLGIPFNTETAIIASIAIGLGVDYAIHVSERFIDELQRSESPAAALDATISGTGGALLASAVTTAGGFGVLMLALVPSLQRFGLVTSVTIVYAFVASVVVLPSLLVLWQRRVPSPAAESADKPATSD